MKGYVVSQSNGNQRLHARLLANMTQSNAMTAHAAPQKAFREKALCGSNSYRNTALTFSIPHMA